MRSFAILLVAVLLALVAVVSAQGLVKLNLDASGSAQFTVAAGATSTTGLVATTSAFSRFGSADGTGVQITVVNKNTAQQVKLQVDSIVSLGGSMALFPDGSKELLTASANSKIGFRFTVVEPADFDGSQLDITLKYNLGLAGAISSIQALITGQVNAAGLQFDADANTYVALDSQYTSVLGISSSVTVHPQWPATKKSIEFYILAFDYTKSIPTSFGFSVSVQATGSASSKTYKYNDQFSIDIAAQTAFKLKSTKSDLSAHASSVIRTETGSNANAGIKAITFMNIDADQSNPQFTGKLQFKYDANFLATYGVKDESTLRFAVYNDASSSWEMLTDGSVDVQNKVIVQSTTHFSEWAIVASASGKASNDGASVRGIGAALAGAAAVATAIALL